MKPKIVTKKDGSVVNTKFYSDARPKKQTNDNKKLSKYTFDKLKGKEKYC